MSLSEDHKNYMRELQKNRGIDDEMDDVINSYIQDNNYRHNLQKGVNIKEGSKSKTTDLLDNVNSPKHYNLLGDPDGVYNSRHEIMSRHPNIPHSIIDDWSRSVEYMLRMFDKNGLEDAKKAQWYLNKLIERMEENG